MNHLFVYGALKPGFSNHYILTNIGGAFFKATLYGFQFDRNWEKETGYPGLVEANKDAKVEGFLFVSKNLTKNLKFLDDFETKAYKRKIVTITLKDDKKVDGFVYLINKNFDIKNF